MKNAIAAPVSMQPEHSRAREALIVLTEWFDRLTVTPRAFVVFDIALILLFFCR